MRLKCIFFPLIVAVFFAESSFAQTKSHNTPKTVYVLIRGYAAIRESPDSVSREMCGAKFGEWLNVIKDYKKWFEVNVPNSNNARVGYIRKSEVVTNLTQIPLTNDDLGEPYRYDVQDTVTSYPNIKIRLISKQQFYAMKKTAADYFVADTNVIIKHKHTLKLPVKKGFKTFIDRDENGTDWDSYFYIGQYPALNKYVIYRADQEAEDDNCLFVDKTTGVISKTGFPGFPYLSIDKKMLICVHAANADEDYAALSVGKITGHHISDYGYCLFKNWMPAPAVRQFWGSDGCFYLPVIPSAVYLSTINSNKQPGYNYRYIKIKINGPSKIPKY